MQSRSFSVLSLFETKTRFEAPLFQRQYVWNLEEQWKPLWEDIQRKFIDFEEDRQNKGVSAFLGGMVFDQAFSPTGYVSRRQIIDGQQRLTTLQIFIAAMRDFCHAHSCNELAEECGTYVENKGMKDDQSEKFKIWPTVLDREQFEDVINSGSLYVLQLKYPPKRKTRSRHIEARPKMVEAYCYFYARLVEFFTGVNDADDHGTVIDERTAAINEQRSLSWRLATCFRALKTSLSIVVMDLDKDDDAQITFETLNALGAPLLPVDLLRNFIFLRADRNKEDVESLHKEFWQPFDKKFWVDPMEQGRRTNRPRSDLFLQHYLANRLSKSIPIKHLFLEYRSWINHERPFASVRSELQALAQQRDWFERIIKPSPDDVIFRLASFLQCYGGTTVYPLLLQLFELETSGAEWKAISHILESYLLRRAVCKLPIDGYNLIFQRITRELKKPSALPSSARIQEHLGSQNGTSFLWPGDDLFYAAWSTHNLYSSLRPTERLTYILKCINEHYLTSRHENITINTPLTIEHIMPMAWQAHWPLDDDHEQLAIIASQPAPESPAAMRREQLISTIGNLTLITKSLNSTVQNDEWPKKKIAFADSTLLPINRDVARASKWDEEEIQKRTKDLFAVANQIWTNKDVVPGPIQPEDPRIMRLPAA